MKCVGLAFAGLGFVTGCVAAWFWWRASTVIVDVPGDWTYDSPGSQETLVALLTAGRKSAEPNKQAAGWTAVSVGLNTIATLLLAYPTAN